MSGMNFIPANMARQQRNQKILSESGKALLVTGAFLLLAFLALNTYNNYLATEIAQLSTLKNEINTNLQERDTQALELKKIQNIAASLGQLNSFLALSQSLDMLNISIPDETQLNTLLTEFNQAGDTIILLEGIADSHKNLTTWVSDLQSYNGVKSAELLASNSIQSASADELRQRFSLQIIQTADRDASS